MKENKSRHAGEAKRGGLKLPLDRYQHAKLGAPHHAGAITGRPAAGAVIALSLASGQ